MEQRKLVDVWTLTLLFLYSCAWQNDVRKICTTKSGLAPCNSGSESAAPLNTEWSLVASHIGFGNLKVPLYPNQLIVDLRPVDQILIEWNHPILDSSMEAPTIRVAASACMGMDQSNGRFERTPLIIHGQEVGAFVQGQDVYTTVSTEDVFLTIVPVNRFSFLIYFYRLPLASIEAIDLDSQLFITPTLPLNTRYKVEVSVENSSAQIYSGTREFLLSRADFNLNGRIDFFDLDPMRYLAELTFTGGFNPTLPTLTRFDVHLNGSGISDTDLGLGMQDYFDTGHLLLDVDYNSFDSNCRSI